MPEIVDLSCSYKTNNLHGSHTETSYHLMLRLPKTSKYATGKYINILTPRVLPIDLPNRVTARYVPELGMWDFLWRIPAGSLVILDLRTTLFSKCFFECCDMDVTGEMNRALSVDRIPTSRIC
jgi:hypothetical protein